MRRLSALDVSRMFLALIFLTRTTPLANVFPIPLAHVTGPLLGWPQDGWSGAWWNLELPPSLQIFLSIVRTIAIMAFFVGFHPRITRVSGVVAGVCGLIALSQNPFGFIFTLYTLFVGTIALALSDDPISKRSPLRIVHVFVISIYVWSAIAKLSAGWLSGDTLRALAEDGLLSPWVAELLTHHDSLFRVAAISVVLTEATIPIALAFRQTRIFAIAGALIFHVLLELATHPDVMTLVIFALLISFFSLESPALAWLWKRARDLWVKLWSEHTSPREIGLAVATGVFIGCTPALGFHGWIALGVATVANLNRIWAWVGSRISNILILPWLVIVEIEIGHHLRFGGWLHLTKEEVMDRRGKLFVDWLIGSLPVGIVAAVVFGLLAFGLAHLRLRRNPPEKSPENSEEKPAS